MSTSRSRKLALLSLAGAMALAALVAPVQVGDRGAILTFKSAFADNNNSNNSNNPPTTATGGNGGSADGSGNGHPGHSGPGNS